MNRRDFMVAASGVAGAGAATTVVTPVAGQENETGDEGSDTEDAAEESGDSAGGDSGNETGENGNATAGGGEGEGGGGAVEEVSVVDNAFEPDSLTIEPGTTVRWIWEGNGHNVEPTDIPDESDWEGHLELEDAGFEYEHTFEVEGEYHYVCRPHVGLGMEGDIIVDSDAGSGAGAAEVDVHDVGVPIQKHFVGIATFLAIFVSLVFTFYLLKYGESPHSSSPGRK